MTTQTLKTSITIDRFRKWKSKAELRSELRCKKIAGLFAIKLQRGVSWRLRYTSPVDGRRKTATIPASNAMRPAEAAEVASQWRDGLANGIDPQLNKVTQAAAQRAADQAEAARQYVNTGRYFEDIYTPFQIREHRSGRETLGIIKRNFGHLFDRDMDQLKSADLDAWFNHRREQGVSLETVRRALTPFKAMIAHATKKRGDEPAVLDQNPLKSYSLPNSVADQEEVQLVNDLNQQKRGVIPQHDLAGIRTGLAKFAEEKREQRRRSRAHGKQHLTDLDNAHFAHWFEPFALIAWMTGARPGDIRVMRWENLHYNPFAKDGEAKFTLVFRPAKTKGKGHRKPIEVQFPVEGFLLEVIQHWRKQQGDPQSGCIFASERTGGPFNRKSYQKPWARVKLLGGVSEGLHFYSFRHHFISQMVMSGEPITNIAELVGHVDGSMIEEHYSHLSPSRAQSMVARFSKSQLGVENQNKEASA